MNLLEIKATTLFWIVAMQHTQALAFTLKRKLLIYFKSLSLNLLKKAL